MITLSDIVPITSQLVSMMVILNNKDLKNNEISGDYNSTTRDSMDSYYESLIKVSVVKPQNEPVLENTTESTMVNHSRPMSHEIISFKGSNSLGKGKFLQKYGVLGEESESDEC